MTYGDTMYTIRKYKESDKNRLRLICRETTGEENKKSENKLRSITLIFNDYFTENEPDNIFVAVDENDEPVGYVICSTNLRKFRKKMLTTYALRVLKTYPLSLPLHIASVIAVFIAKRRYRVHLHIDLLPEAQRKGLGTKLIDELCAHLKKLGIKNVSVMTIERHSMGYPFYKKYGFRVVSKIPGKRYTMTYDIR